MRGTAHENGARNKNDEFSNMADGRHIGFVKSAIRAMMVNKHRGCYNFDYNSFISDISTDIVCGGVVDIVGVTKCP